MIWPVPLNRILAYCDLVAAGALPCPAEGLIWVADYCSHDPYSVDIRKMSLTERCLWILGL